MAIAKKYYILLALRQAPLDRIHIMKALFLVWHKSGRKIKDYFEFVPYLYGPCSFEVYSELEKLKAEGFIVQPLHPMPQWANYYLTEKGKKDADESVKKVSPNTLRLLKEVSEEVSRLSFYELLKIVYKEAPDFAVNSMFRGVLR